MRLGNRSKWSSSVLLFIVFLSVLLVLSSFQSSSAHPVYVDSSPGAFQSVSSSPQEVSVSFSEAIELGYSRIFVLDASGTRVDMNDPHYVEGDTASLAVTVQPDLPVGDYTVRTRVLSAVDGHVVESTFIFGVGTTPVRDSQGNGTPILEPGYSASRFPGMVGQVMAVGGAFGALWLWKPIGRVPWLAAATSDARAAADRRMLKIIIVGAGLVLGSGVAMIIVQAVSIEASVTDAVATKFGNIWITRMLQSSILMGIAVSVFRRVAKTSSAPTKAELYAMLIIGLAVLVTSSLIAHAAATEQTLPIVLDFFHSAAASLWIGGVILLGFAFLPKLVSIKDEKVRSSALSLMIPRFSIIVVTILGVSVITGPILLSSLESDLSLTLASVYGQILAIKLTLAGAMVAMGAYSQFVVQKRAVSVMTGGTQVAALGLRHYDRILKAEAGVGIALLLAVSLMSNGALPSGQFPSYTREPGEQEAFAEGIDTRYHQTAFIEEGQIRLSIAPFAVGQNTFTVSFLDNEKSHVSGIESARVKLTQIEKGIGPISVETKRQSEGVFAANASFSLPGPWEVEIEGVNTQGNNMIGTIDVNVKPLPSNLEFSIKEYKTPDRSSPYFPVFDPQRQSIWAGDTVPGSGRIWQLDISTGNYTAHKVDGFDLVVAMVLSPDGALWFVDPGSFNDDDKGVLGYLNPDGNSTKLFTIPEVGFAVGIAIDGNGSLWIPVVQANKVVRFDPSTEQFSSFELPTPDAEPVAVAADSQGHIWVAEAAGGIARIHTASGNITEYQPEMPGQELDEPAAVLPDPTGSTIFVSEHSGDTVTAFKPLLGTFRTYPVVNEAGLPFGMALDSYGNLWFAEHTIDRIGVIDPRTGASTEVRIPISGSFIQWITSDNNGRIWFAAQQGSSLGSITTAFKPASPGQPDGGDGPGPISQLGFSLSDIAGPGIAAGIIISALVYTKSSRDLSRNVRAALRAENAQV